MTILSDHHICCSYIMIRYDNIFDDQDSFYDEFDDEFDNDTFTSLDELDFEEHGF